MPDFRSIRFTEQQLLWLYFLEWNMVRYDTANTEQEQAGLKEDWLDEWKEKVLATLGNRQTDCLIEDEDLLYAVIREEAAKDGKPSWLYAFALELIRFTPYYSLDESKKYRKLNYRSDYIRDVFCRKQVCVTERDARKMKELCSRYEGKIRGRLNETLLRTGIRIIFVSVPYMFLISRLLSTGICAIVDRLGEAASLYTLNECSKLAALCDYVVLGEKPTAQDCADVSGICRELKRQAEDLERRIRETEEKKEKDDRTKTLKVSGNYLSSCAFQLNRLLRRNGFS